MSTLTLNNHLLSHPGKDIRSALISAFSTWIPLPPAHLELVQKVVGMLHNASLLVDDIEDGSELRRGEAAGHVVFGVPQTINCANYVYFQALQELFASLPPEMGGRAAGVYAEEMVHLHRGQGIELFWRDGEGGRVPRVEEYLKMVENSSSPSSKLIQNPH